LWQGQHVDDLAALDLTDAALYRHGFPHAVFTRLRREAPVWWHAAPAGFLGADDGFWVLSRYADVVAANCDTERFSAIDGPSLIDRPEMRGTMLVSMDGREHARQRRLISAGFTPRMLRRLEEQMRRWAVAIVERALERGAFDFVEDVAYQLPMHMIADIVGIPVEDRQWLFDLTTRFLQAGDPNAPLAREQQMAIQAEMFEYGRRLGQQKRAHPQDDVWTILSTVEGEGDDGRRAGLAEIELDLFFLLLTVAGSETTRNAIAIGLVALLDHPEQLETLRRDPRVLPTAVEEIVRWSSPVAYFARRATRDTEIRGVPIAAGQRIGQPRRGRLRRSVPLRHPPLAERPRGVRRWWPALLPRRQPGAPRDHRPVRGAAGARPAHRVAGAADVGRARHLQPDPGRAEGAAGTPRVAGR
jgi:cytochrome P450